MSIKITGSIIGVMHRSYQAIDKKNGQKVERKVCDIRIELPAEMGTSAFPEIGVCCFDESQVISHIAQMSSRAQITVAVRQLKEQAGFFQIYGDVVKVEPAKNAK